MLYSYVIKSPDYLETPEAIEQYNNELQAERERKERIQSKFQTKSINCSLSRKHFLLLHLYYSIIMYFYFIPLIIFNSGL